MTQKEILEQTKSELDRLVSEAKRKLDNLYRPKLELGKWYKDTDERSNLLVYITDIKDDEIVGYGFGVSGKWLAPNRKFYSWNIHNAYSFLVEATDQEVEDALVKEAKRRGLLYGVNIISPNGEDWGYKVTSNDFRFDQVNNTLYSTYNLGGTVFLFKDGKWAEVIEKPTDKFAELKEAYRNGAIIEYFNNITNEWTVIQGAPHWLNNVEYRIKPEEKPEVGDIVKAWDEEENEFVIGVLSTISEAKYKYYVGGGFFFKNAKKISKQEVIDLLFGKES